MLSPSHPRTVLVTGAAKRIGREIAIALAKSGWRVAVHYRQSHADAIETANACSAYTLGCTTFQANLSDEQDVRRLFDSVVSATGALDAVVNNASTFEYDNPENFSYANLTKHLLGNAAAPVLLTHLLHKHVSERSAKGVVLNLLDQKLWNINPDFLSYTMSKAALQMANSMLAQALSPTLRVCAIAPGLSYPSYLQDDAAFARASKFSLTKEISSPSDIAKAAVFMLETESISGATLLVDSGQHLTAMGRDVSFL